MNNLIIGAAIRGLTVALSGFFVGKGYVTGDEFQTIVGSITAIGGLAYSIYTRTTNKQIADTASLPKVAAVKKTNGAIVVGKDAASGNG